MNAKQIHAAIATIEERIGNGVKVEIFRRGRDLVIHFFFFNIETTFVEYINDAQDMDDQEAEQAMEDKINKVQEAYEKLSR